MDRLAVTVGQEVVIYDPCLNSESERVSIDTIVSIGRKHLRTTRGFSNLDGSGFSGKRGGRGRAKIYASIDAYRQEKNRLIMLGTISRAFSLGGPLYFCPDKFSNDDITMLAQMLGIDIKKGVGDV